MSKRVAAVASGLGILLAFSARAADPPILPRMDITPGAVATSCTIHDICPHERPGLRGNVSASMRKAILGDYGITGYCDKPGACELDHSIPVELCGATVSDNMWPQSYLYPEGARMKDWLENDLHRRVCAGDIPLRDAQKVISTDWLGAFVKYGGGEKFRAAADMKDDLESELHGRVSDGTMPLRDAQKVIETDWMGAYVKFVQEPTGDK